MSKKKKALFIMTLIAIQVLLNAGLSPYAAERYLGERISGKDRYETAIKISQTGWTSNSTENVVLATGQSFPDALCAAPLAKMLNAPILLTAKSELTQDLKDELERLSAENVFIVGGKGVISEEIEKELKDMGMNVERLSGEDRYGTSIDVAEYIAKNSKEFESHKTIIVATGLNYPDALSIAPIAAAKDMPIILSHKSIYNDSIDTFLDEYEVEKTYVIGGESAIEEGIFKKLPDAERVYGSGRYDTNIEILETFKDDIDFDTVYLATGNDFPDALAGSALAVKTLSPLVLVDGKPNKVTKDFIAKEYPSISEIKVLGGEGVVHTSTLEELIPEIKTLANISITVCLNERNFRLPQKVMITLSNKEKKEVPVTWNIDNIDTSQLKSYKIKGTVEGYDGEVVLNLDVKEPPEIEKHSIMGESDLTPEQMTAYVKEKNPDFNPEIAKAFIEVGKKYGVRGDIAFAQSIHETNFFKFTGDVKPEQNNFAGLGATGGGNPGHSFETIEDGVAAQIIHLIAYATKEPVPEEDAQKDPRFKYVPRGVAPTWEDLSGWWAVPGYGRELYNSLYEAFVAGGTYGQKIYWYYEQMKKVQVP